MPRRRIIAKFIPQAWINGYAADIDGRADVDVTRKVLALGRAEALSLEDRKADFLVEGSRPQRAHKGPFRVEVEASIREYFAPGSAPRTEEGDQDMGRIADGAVIEATLQGFTGSELFYAFHDLRITEGIKFLAESAGAWWLLDAIWSHQPKCRRDPMLRECQFWRLKVDLARRKAVLTCEADAGDTRITQKIRFTDFPLEEVKVWVEGNTILLPSEH